MSNNQAFSGTIERRAFVKELISLCPEALVIGGLGSSTYDMFAAGDRDQNFYLWGAMGGAAAIGLGLALAQPNKSVVVITGDGEQLMGMGALATINAQQPKNLTIVVLDNGHFGETGMQHSHSSLGTDLTAVSKACGIAHSFKVKEASEVKTIHEHVLARAGVAFAQVYVKADDLPRALPSRDGVHIKNRFRQTLGLAPL